MSTDVGIFWKGGRGDEDSCGILWERNRSTSKFVGNCTECPSKPVHSSRGVKITYLYKYNLILCKCICNFGGMWHTVNGKAFED